VSVEPRSRRLAAILAADVVGYSRLIGADEPGTISKLASVRSSVIDPLMATHGGRIFKTTGDGLLAEFASGVQAVQCAIAIQQAMREHEGLEIRIGLHSADVTVQPDGDLLGDGVNVAARLEGLAEPGGICISGRVREDAVGKMPLEVEDVGAPPLKNIAQPVHVFRVRLGEPERPGLPLPDKPSIAVLPFQNMSGDAEQEYFADGMVEEIITGLTRVRSFFVIARNSSFAYKGKSPDVRQVGRDLGVRYVLEGSVRKAGNRVRITGQLVDTTAGAHIWAQNFEGMLDDIFDLQDRVSEGVVAAIAPRIRAAETERAKRKPPESLDAYDLVLRALPHLHSFTREGFAAAEPLLEKAITIEADYAFASAALAFCYYLPWQQGWTDRDRKPIAEIARLTQQAVEHAGDDAEALAWATILTAWTTGDVDGAWALADRAMSANPNCATAFFVAGQVAAYAGNPDKGLELLERSERLDPQDHAGRRFYAMALAHFIAGRYEKAAEFTARTLRPNPSGISNLRLHAASLGLLGRIDEAREAAQRLLAISPDWTISRVRYFLEVVQSNPFRTPGVIDAICEGLRRAGLPE
jgi:adenylate cyclase